MAIILIVFAFGVYSNHNQKGVFIIGNVAVIFADDGNSGFLAGIFNDVSVEERNEKQLNKGPILLSIFISILVFIFIVISWITIRLIKPKEEYFDFTKPKLKPWKPAKEMKKVKENLFDDDLFDNEFN